jgi:hypothetical protein
MAQPTRSVAFSNDGRELYGIHHATANWSLFRIEVATARLTEVRDLAMEHRPATLEGWSGRLAFMQDGNHILYSTGQFDSSLWLLRGFQPPRLVDRLLGRH